MEAGHEAAEIAFFEVVGGFDLTGDEAAAEGGVGDCGDAEVAASLQEADLGVFDVDGEGGVFDLNSGDMVDGAGAAEGGGGDFGEAKVFDFACSSGWEVCK